MLLAVSVVNAPEPGVTLPIALDCNPPVVAVLNVPVVNAPLPGVTLPIATACRPPVVAVLNAPVVNVPAAGVTLPITPCTLAVVKLLNVGFAVVLKSCGVLMFA